MKNELVQWIIRFIKGIFIGSGAILPGVSGGALAAVFGIYEEIIQFIPNIKKEFKSKLLFFLPVGLGGLFGIIVLAYPIESLLRNHPVFILLFFMGCIFGTVPLLYRKAKLHGQKKWHIYLTVFTAIISFILLILANSFLDVQVAQTPVTWIMVGFIFALGFIVPGLSPSNFLIYMNLYEPLTRGISRLDWMILLPVGLGALVCVISLSKLVNHLMNFYYTMIFHFILGVVIASTVIIFPSQNQWSQLSLFGLVFSVVLFIIGLFLGLWMGRLELKHKPED